MIITTPGAVSTRVRDEEVRVHPVQFSHLTPDIPADRQRFAHVEHDAAPPCSPVLFRVPLAAQSAGDATPLRQNRTKARATAGR
jgi:hypothetical protein